MTAFDSLRKGHRPGRRPGTWDLQRPGRRPGGQFLSSCAQSQYPPRPRRGS